MSAEGAVSSTDRLTRYKFLMCVNWSRNDVGSQPPSNITVSSQKGGRSWINLKWINWTLRMDRFNQISERFVKDRKHNEICW